jgi:hypothetical protein
MLTAVILICAAELAAEVRDCTRENAADVMRVPGEYSSPVTCFVRGQAFIAETSIAADLRAGDRLKVDCRRKGV